MSNYKNVLVAIDINSQYESVIQKALTICDSVDELSLLYIPMPSIYIQPYLYGANLDMVEDTTRIELASEKLKGIAKQFGIAEEKVLLKVGEAGDEIKHIADKIKADLIVIGTHGRSGIKLLLGSTANSVLHGVKQDVLAVRIHED
ncbi:universal stress protein [Paraglaciecola sp. L3A3]|uniref:universal stress protein n=1 Tax=Paraglaciecola sp. L3A3 TaxID=2686358 RepID=UPI00131D4619|nr:universal stress protein [Paraglaciecola sp. L3A3]